MGTKTILIVIVIALFLSALLASFYVTQQRQDLRTNASGSTVLSFSTTSSFGKPITKRVNDDLSMDIRIDPGRNQLSILKFEILFDPNNFGPSSQKMLEINQDVFPTIVEGPIIDTSSGRIAVTLSIGTNTKGAIKTPTTIGKVNFRMKRETIKEPEVISFSTKSQAFSMAPEDHAYSNVLATALPAYVYISEGTFVPSTKPTISSRPSASGTPTSSRPFPARTPTPADTPTPTPTPEQSDTVLSLSAFLHGIGQGGDLANPTGNNLSNKNPLRVGRDIKVALTNTEDNTTSTQSGMLIYTNGSGAYQGTINLKNQVKKGEYIVKLQVDTFLWKRIPGVHAIERGSRLTMDPVELVAGDSNNDNTLDILDFNLIMDCYSEYEGPKACDDDKYLISDLNDDGFINQNDYNLFVREIAAQQGD